MLPGYQTSRVTDASLVDFTRGLGRHWQRWSGEFVILEPKMCLFYFILFKSLETSAVY